jgi:hypothetical protein
MCTSQASDRVVPGSDRAGFGMFPGDPSVCKGWNAVRVPPRARITPRQRGFCFNVWTLTLRGSLRRCPRFVCGAAVAGLIVCGAGAGSWPVGLPPARIQGSGPSFLLFRWPVLRGRSFMVRSCGDDMTKRNCLRGFFSDSCFLRDQSECAHRVFVRPKGVCTLCTLLCTGGLAACILIPSSWLCLHYFMQFSVSDDMTLRPGA